ncbi:hypothetical protein A2721_03030 [Candidatus Gottesmanbacteria bacterium RIFCSPHIGHO2_01_FULL_47_48]|uniref:Peptidase M50 domain-containing protein n=1 Tax=Candidatus Gottesmanbacteria bacterium RIFCSPHIGHO2_01_FULL_47_48 TaxID=1798381 RepID=A0A1F6A4L0_9BACT|nr:MAG: hypothetical protein A2721_03030 [Candidatus Gottesmanbacteria bacterium RIFCSPHIGHO2_01_FULL_47_48]
MNSIMPNPELTSTAVEILIFGVLIYSVILHEIAHGFVADKLGDPTARLAKRLTLNPLPHIDLIYTILLPLFLYLSNAGIIFGAAKPVPVDPFNFKEPKKDSALVALAGPATNLTIAVFLSLLLRASDLFIMSNALKQAVDLLATQGIFLNVMLAVFNLIPIPPLDGSKVLAGVLSDELASEIYKLERFGFLIIFAILIFFPSLIFGLMRPIIFQITSLLLR